jgi:hypothetical protein
VSRRTPSPVHPSNKLGAWTTVRASVLFGEQSVARRVLTGMCQPLCGGAAGPVIATHCVHTVV